MKTQMETIQLKSQTIKDYLAMSKGVRQVGNGPIETISGRQIICDGFFYFSKS